MVLGMRDMVPMKDNTQSKIESAARREGEGGEKEFITRFDLTPCMRFSGPGCISFVISRQTFLSR